MKSDIEQAGGMTAEEHQRAVDARRFLPWVTEQHTSELNGETAAGRELKAGEIQPDPYWFDETLPRCECYREGYRQLCSHQTRHMYFRWKCNQCGQEFCTYVLG